MASLNGKALSVELTDALHAGFLAAMERAKVVLESENLVDQISKSDWEAWDAFAENGLVADRCDVDDEDLPQLDEAA